MDSRSKITQAERVMLVVCFEAGMGSDAGAKYVGCGVVSARTLWARWRIHGRLCLVSKPKNKRYPFELKCEAVERVLAGESKPAVAKDLALSSPKILAVWMRIYREKGFEGLRPNPRGRPKGSSVDDNPGVSEVEMLSRRVEYLEAENAYLKKLRDLRSQQHA